MEIIQNIINYDPEYLENLSVIATKRCNDDEKLDKLCLEKERIGYFLHASQIVFVICMAFISSVLITESDLTLTLPPLVVMAVIIAFTMTLPSRHKKNLIAGRRIINSHISPAVQYHHMVSTNQFLVCYGKIADSSRFEAIIIALANTDDSPAEAQEDGVEVDRLCICPIVFRFDNTNTSGVLTLDVGNEVVFYGDPSHG